MDFYATFYEEGKWPFYTLSAVDLSKAGNVVNTLDILANELVKDARDATLVPAVHKARMRTASFKLRLPLSWG